MVEAELKLYEFVAEFSVHGSVLRLVHCHGERNIFLWY